MAINLSKLPQDCSVETLFPQWEELFKSKEAQGYVRFYAGEGMGYLKTPFWGTCLDPCEDNNCRSDGSLDNDFYIFLCKWMDGSPITVRYYKEDILKEVV